MNLWLAKMCIVFLQSIFPSCLCIGNMHQRAARYAQYRCIPKYSWCLYRTTLHTRTHPNWNLKTFCFWPLVHVLHTEKVSVVVLLKKKLFNYAKWLMWPWLLARLFKYVFYIWKECKLSSCLIQIKYILKAYIVKHSWNISCSWPPSAKNGIPRKSLHFW